MYSFAYPWLLLLIALPLAIKHFLPTHHQHRTAVKVPFLDLISQITGEKPSQGASVTKQSRPQLIITWIAWILIVTAIARPQYFEPPINKTIPSRDLLLAIDLSGSMSTEDFKSPNHKQPVDRLTAVKEVVDDFLTKRKNDRVGLILFGSAAFVQAPFTDDLPVCRQLLSEAQVGMAGPKTAIGDAIGLSINVFENSELEDKVLLLLTDGNDTSSQVPPDEAARIASTKGITIHTIAVGDPEAAGEEKLDEASLKKISNTTGGSFYRALNRKELEHIYSEIDAIGTRKTESISYRPRNELYFYPLLALVISVTLFQATFAIIDYLKQNKLRQETSQPANEA